MHRSRRDISSISASALLTVFLMGGLLAPVVHRAHHGQQWAERHADAPASCDHTQHSDSFEAAAPDFLDDDCLLCVRHLLSFDGMQAAPTALHDCSAYAFAPQVAPQPSHFILLPIRGPPLAS